MTQDERRPVSVAGHPAEQVLLQGGGLTAHLLSYGATLQDLRHDGVDHPLVLGAEDPEAYAGPQRYFGAIVGRFANRIAGGRFVIDGVAYRVSRNFLGKHCLHGGEVGASEHVWTFENVAADTATLALTLPDGDMGFPGTLTVRARYTLPGRGVLDIDITAETDAPTPCSFTHHSYFNLDGSADIAGHILEVNAEAYLPVDAEMIPTGEIAPVTGTRFDFRKPRPVGKAAIDHNFCLADGQAPIRPVARLTGPESGLAMTVETTAPGLQVYNAAHISATGIAGIDGCRYGPRAGLALEPQAWPDAPNHPGFPNAILRPGETYRHRMRFMFSKPGEER